MPFFDDAPLIEIQDTAEGTDYYHFDSPDAPADGQVTATGAWADDFLDTVQVTDAGGGTDPLTFDAEDTFAFIPFGPQDGSATGDNSTPAPPEEPEVNPLQELIDREMTLDRARHSATLAYLQRVLVYGD